MFTNPCLCPHLRLCSSVFASLSFCLCLCRSISLSRCRSVALLLCHFVFLPSASNGFGKHSDKHEDCKGYVAKAAEAAGQKVKFVTDQFAMCFDNRAKINSDVYLDRTAPNFVQKVSYAQCVEASAKQGSPCVVLTRPFIIVNLGGGLRRICERVRR